MLGYVHMYDSSFRAMIETIRSIPDFRSLRENDQIACLKGAVGATCAYPFDRLDH
jgi:hypothetical protein